MALDCENGAKGIAADIGENAAFARAARRSPISLYLLHAVAKRRQLCKAFKLRASAEDHAASQSCCRCVGPGKNMSVSQRKRVSPRNHVISP